ncbi:MAG: hypothetical protein NC115_11050 [Bacteroidales bacterium]|nr:hypothetical protein [Bacteroidales bacterium]
MESAAVMQGKHLQSTIRLLTAIAGKYRPDRECPSGNAGPAKAVVLRKISCRKEEKPGEKHALH